MYLHCRRPIALKWLGDSEIRLINFNLCTRIVSIRTLSCALSLWLIDSTSSLWCLFGRFSAPRWALFCTQSVVTSLATGGIESSPSSCWRVALKYWLPSLSFVVYERCCNMLTINARLSWPRICPLLNSLYSLYGNFIYINIYIIYNINIKWPFLFFDFDFR